MKEPAHLREKLERKIEAAGMEGRAFEITEDNLFLKINDLAGIRLLHLHTRQMEKIHRHLSEAFDEGDRSNLLGSELQNPSVDQRGIGQR